MFLKHRIGLFFVKSSLLPFMVFINDNTFVIVGHTESSKLQNLPGKPGIMQRHLLIG